MTIAFPANAGNFERTTLEAASSELAEFDADYAAFWYPMECPEDALPLLAHALGLPLWREEWSTPKKRAVLLEWPEIAGKLGTEAAIRWAVDVADAEIELITVPPQAFYLSGSDDEDKVRWAAWLAALPEVRLLTMREQDLECGYLCALDQLEDMVDVGMFLADDDGVPTFFLGAPTLDERAVIIRDGVEEEIFFERIPDPRWKRKGQVINFFWPGDAGAGFMLDDVGSVDQYLDGAPPTKSHALVSFVFGATDAWPLVAPVDRVQEVTPTSGVLYEEDGVGLFADDFWTGQFIDELDPLRATYLSFRIIEGAPDWTPAASFLDFDRFSMEYHTAEILTRVPLTAGSARLVCNHAYLDDAFGGEPAEFPEVELLCHAIDTTKSRRDTVFADFDIRVGTDLTKLTRLSDLTL
ncbi:phage tail protein I [Shinella kummerowiae]|uniref:phage tail protein I n=1 Tax=Shinella kummerowiae TaxID=417745 RepID=UPI0021B60B82|nr:phage tail protein I [Shinella kummerowiae]MCT7668161.1 phage tail protein I [Shinella kummerowiae]